MTITIDDGTFIVGNSFVTLDEADTFHEDRGNSAWFDETDEDKEAALVRAFDFLSVQNWRSTTFEDEIPVKIEKAQCIAALKEISSSGTLQPDVTTGIKSESIEGVLATEYFEDGSATLFTAVENLISPYINRPGYKTRIVRGGGEQT